MYLLSILIGLPIFFVLRWISKKYIKTSFKGIIPWVGTILLTPIIYLGITFFIMWYITYYPSEKFDQNKWKMNPDKRYPLTQNMLDRDILIDLNKNQITALLGETSDFTSDQWHYYIGNKPGLSLDVYYIVIEFENDRVVQVKEIRS